MTRNGEKQRSNVNIAGRVNKVVASNIGGGGSTHGASSSQRVRIRQDRTGTYEDVETIERTVGPADRSPDVDLDPSQREPGSQQRRSSR